MPQATVPVDETTLDVLQARLYPRLEQALLASMRRERERVPPYYEQFVGSEIRRLEEAIEYNGQRIEETRERLERRIRIEELRLYIDHRFTQVDQRFAQVDQRFAQVDQRFAQMDQRFDRLETRLERFAQVDQRFDRLETRLDEMNVRFRNWALAAVAFLGILTTVG